MFKIYEIEHKLKVFLLKVEGKFVGIMPYGIQIMKASEWYRCCNSSGSVNVLYTKKK